MEFCAEKCKHGDMHKVVAELCDKKESEITKFPAPQCLYRSGKGDKDLFYWPKFEVNGGRYHKFVTEEGERNRHKIDSKRK